MDTKAMAKSKRSHSQHHSKKYRLNSTSKAPTHVGSSGVKDPKLTSTKEQIGVISDQFQGKSSLPGNWDRYEEEHDSESEDLVGFDPSRYSDVVKPKSKGADYKYLIMEAKSQSECRLDDSLDCFASLDDLLPDFYTGLGFILSVRGERILSSTRDDNFIVDDKTTTSSEAPFLSLNLHTLAEQLAKLDPSKRLFIEAELLPPDLRADESKASSKHESNEVPISCTEAAFAEAELDMLLSSFGETKLYNSSKSKANPCDSVDDILNESSNEMNQKVALLHKDVTFITIDDSIDDLLSETSKKMNQSSTFLCKDRKSISIHDSIDDLLEETSTTLNQKIALQHKEEKFISMDDSIDDLLAETSNPGNEFRVSQTRNVRTFSVEKNSVIPSESAPKLKVMADFDSWLDTI